MRLPTSGSQVAVIDLVAQNCIGLHERPCRDVIWANLLGLRQFNGSSPWLVLGFLADFLAMPADAAKVKKSITLVCDRLNKGSRPGKGGAQAAAPGSGEPPGKEAG